VGLHGGRIILPRSARNRPAPDRLDLRYRQFLDEERRLAG